MNANAESESNLVRVAVLGASGYTGAELVRILCGHPAVTLRALTADRHAGKPLADVFPHFRALDLPDLIRLDDVDWRATDAVFCCLPHGTTQPIVESLPKHLKIIDLSADFRISDEKVYEQWYGATHRAPQLQKEAVYGLTEISRRKIAGARLVANPGCYPTSAQLPLIPLLASGNILATDIIVDAKSGVSGAGRSAKERNLFAEVGEGLRAYGIAHHRHAPEIEQGLSEAAGHQVAITFTPHLVPMNRGILATTYARLAPGSKVSDVKHVLEREYRDEPFVHILRDGQVPATQHVRGTNLCMIGIFADRVPERVILVSVIDNLVKGASGQAVQNMNVMFGFEETLGLEQRALFP